MIGGLKLGAIVGAASLVTGLSGGWWLGSSHVKGQWAEADNTELIAQREATNAALLDHKMAQAKVDAMSTALAEKLQDNARLKHELDEAIDLEPVVRYQTRTVTVEGDCPACPVIDTGRHYRLWNNAIRGGAAPVATEAERRDDEVP